ncbi:ABC transporter substrate-binding protein [Fictibacillus phosphorivorans]|uniref:ABC transporter substrate-binding protein n=1 Tax=Fictibacillus phosphorivorans TaxID=1221500 RepID=UPI00203E01CF|nr:sugar ABC transporter substrate-binding protein [Fictibacillus phosphorivorans]MCM3717717.1 sugar ABC transporter substrate-binding protein [Fictibacillus phosphorivorans]MCM3775617.1 sugar ABC transporter substrate-binding protein [Fictibacillus phosphorivorans]
MKKVKFFVSLLLIIMVVAFSACSSGGGSSKNTIEVALWDKNAKESVDKSIEIFNKKHPDIKVNVTYTPWEDYWTKLKTSLGGGSGPDVFWMNGPNFHQYASSKLIRDLEPYIEKDSDYKKDSFYPTVVDLYSYEGKLHAAPYFIDAVGLYYNKKFFDDAGIPYPDETWTWEDIEKVGQKLTDKEKGVYGYTMDIKRSQSVYYNLIPQAGGYIISDDKTKSGFNAPESKEAFHFLDNLMKKGISPSAKTVMETEGKQLFMSEKSAMIPAISVSAGEFESVLGDKLGVAPLPKGKERASIVHGIGWAMNGKTKNDEVAWDLIKALTGKEGSKVIAESGFSIPADKEMSELWLNSTPSLDLQVFLDAQEYGVPYPVSKYTSQWQDIENKEIQSAFLGQKPIDEALDIITEKMNEVLEKEAK